MNRYRFKFYLNASHAIYSKGILGENHPHTWEIILDTIKARQDFVKFDAVEQAVEGFFKKFQDGNINQIPPFDVTNPTLENLTHYFKKQLFVLLSESGWLLTKIEVSETPARSYIIETEDELDELISVQSNQAFDEGTVENVIDEKLAYVLEDK